MENILERRRVLTSHPGSLPRELKLIARLANAGSDCGTELIHAQMSSTIAALVHQQTAVGIDIVSDGERRSAFGLYAQDRISGLEARPVNGMASSRKRFLLLEDFEPYLRKALRRGITLDAIPLICSGPIEYVGHEELASELLQLRQAIAPASQVTAFMPALAPGALGRNEFYQTDQAFWEAAGNAMRCEYQAILAAGFILQVDDPLLPALLSNRTRPASETQRLACDYVEILNHSLRGLDERRIRYHAVTHADQAPTDFARLFPHMIQIRAAIYCFASSGARAELDADLWRMLDWPVGKSVMPGLIDGTASAACDPDAIAERIIGFAQRVGRDAVIASVDPAAADRGAIIWTALNALSEGARRASQSLWKTATSAHIGLSAAA